MDLAFWQKFSSNQSNRKAFMNLVRTEMEEELTFGRETERTMALNLNGLSLDNTN